MSVPVLSTSRARWLAFSVLCSMQLMIVIDISIVTVALRSIQSDLGSAQARIAWVTNAYTIGFGSASIVLLPVMVALGIGGGLAMPAVMMLSMAVESPRDAGVASGLSGTSGMVGDSLGIASLTAIAAATRAVRSRTARAPPWRSSADSICPFGIGAILVALAAAVGFLLLPSARPAPQGEQAPAQPTQPEGVPF